MASSALAPLPATAPASPAAEHHSAPPTTPRTAPAADPHPPNRTSTLFSTSTFGTMLKRRPTAPEIPKLPFFLIRLVQVICCIIILGTLGYFQYQLWKYGYPTPWEFSLIDTAAAFTLVNTFITCIFVCCFGLGTMYLIIVDSFLTVFWLISFACLLHGMGTTTTDKCDIKGWGSPEGVRVCHLFKSLVSFALFALSSFAGSVVFAVIQHRRSSNHRYVPALNPVNTNQDVTYVPGAKTPMLQLGGHARHGSVSSVHHPLRHSRHESLSVSNVHRHSHQRSVSSTDDAPAPAPVPYSQSSNVPTSPAMTKSG